MLRDPLHNPKVCNKYINIVKLLQNIHDCIQIQNATRLKISPRQGWNRGYGRLVLWTFHVVCRGFTWRTTTTNKVWMASYKLICRRSFLFCCHFFFQEPILETLLLLTPYFLLPHSPRNVACNVIVIILISQSQSTCFVFHRAAVLWPPHSPVDSGQWEITPPCRAVCGGPARPGPVSVWTVLSSQSCTVTRACTSNTPTNTVTHSDPGPSPAPP